MQNKNHMILMQEKYFTNSTPIQNKNVQKNRQRELKQLDSKTQCF